MDFEKSWEKALKSTEIIRTRVKALSASDITQVPYIMLSESSINQGDTVVRQGKVDVQKPSLFVPPNNPQFSGFEFDQEGSFNENSFINFLLVRGITLPSLSYDNQTVKLDIYEGGLSKAINHYSKELQHKENVSTGLVAAPEDVWPFSILIFICSQISKNAEGDFKRLIAEYKRKQNDDKK